MIVTLRRHQSQGVLEKHTARRSKVVGNHISDAEGLTLRYTTEFPVDTQKLIRPLHCRRLARCIGSPSGKIQCTQPQTHDYLGQFQAPELSRGSCLINQRDHARKLEQHARPPSVRYGGPGLTSLPPFRLRTCLHNILSPVREKHGQAA